MAASSPPSRSALSGSGPSSYSRSWTGSLALTPNDKLVLALLYEAGGQWPKAQAQFDFLVTQYPGVPHFLAQYVQLLLRHDELAGPRRS